MENVLANAIDSGYETLSCIKENENMSVFLVYDKICQRKALLKHGRADLLENEAHILAGLSCGGVPEVYGCFEENGTACLIRQYIEGQSLREIIENQGCFTEKEAAGICIQICGILTALHEKDPPVIHRDIKSDNIILTPEKQVYLIDFGISREYKRNSSRDTQIMGTPNIAPPEQFGYGQTDERSDIYAAGILLNELVTGSDKLSEERLPRGLAPIIKKCTEFSPDRRYKSAAELKRNLEKFCGKGKTVRTAAAAVLCAVLCAAFIPVIRSYSANVPAAEIPVTENSVTENSVSDYSVKEITVTENPVTDNSAKEITVTENPVTDNSLTEIVVTENPVTENSATDYSAKETTVAEVPEAWEETQTEQAVQTLTANSIYSFADKAVEEEICRQLGKDAAAVTYADLELIEEISLVGNSHDIVWGGFRTHAKKFQTDSGEISEYGSVSSLEDLANMPNLSTVILCNQNISDLSPLAGLNIKRLALHDNNIKDLSPLADCIRLEELFISNNPVTDLSPLTRLGRLSRLNIGATDITSLKDAALIKGLTDLDMCSCNKITDFSSLADMKLTKLSADNLSGCENAAELLNQLTGLETLFIWNYNGIETFSDISALKNLRYVVFDYCGIHSLEGIEKLESLEILQIQHTTLTDMSPLNGNDTIITLWITETYAEDYSPIAGMTALRNVYCDGKQEKALKEALSGSPDISVMLHSI